MGGGPLLQRSDLGFGDVGCLCLGMTDVQTGKENGQAHGLDGGFFHMTYDCTMLFFNR